MTGWLSQVEIPLAELGRVSLPRRRIRFLHGFVRLGYNKDRTRLLATLEDELGILIRWPSQTEACAKAALMGRAIAFRLQKESRYLPGEPTGDREQVRVSLWDNRIRAPKDFDPSCLVAT